MYRIKFNLNNTVDKKRIEELLSCKEKELIEVKSTILQYEETALGYQQELLTYKRDTEAKILMLQGKYTEELKKLSQDKYKAIESLTQKLQEAHDKRSFDVRKYKN